MTIYENQSELLTYSKKMEKEEFLTFW